MLVANTGMYRIESQSRLLLNGTTNINKFACDCVETFPAQQFSTEETDDENCTIDFANTRIAINVRSLDCGNKMMNKDLQTTLQASRHPYIEMELLRVEIEKCALNEGSSQTEHGYSALTKLEINGRSHNYWLAADVYPASHNQLRLVSKVAVDMSDFGITPPTAALGLIKVHDRITIELDIYVTLL